MSICARAQRSPRRPPPSLAGLGPTGRLRDTLVAAVIRSGRAAAEAGSSFGVSWWLVQRALDSAPLTRPDVGVLKLWILGIDEHRYRSVRFFRDLATKAWKRYGPWMTTIVDLNSGQVHDLPVVEGNRTRHRHRCDNGESGSKQRSIKHIKRTGRGFTNALNFKTRILLRSAARTAA